MYITRPDGRIVEVDDISQCTMLLQKAGWRKSTEAEIDQLEMRKNELFARTAAGDGKTDIDLPNVYYQTVAASPDGYGMSRDIIKSEVFQNGIMLQEEYNNQKVGLLYSYPNGVTQMRSDVRLIMTMFESDKIPEDWPDYLSQADEIIVPSKFCADTFARAGIATTIVPLGYNDRAFSYIERTLPTETDDTVFTFIHYSSFNMRKGFAEVFKAFTEEFKTNEPVKLILKTTDHKPALPIFPQEYPNIEVICGKVTEKELNDLLGSANCMVYPSRGEGFGITPLEAMATGLPAIVPNAHGISEYFNANYMLEVKIAEKCPGLYASFKGQDVGEMVICDVKHLRKQMRYAYNHQAEMKQLGKSASEYVKKFTYQITAQRLAEILRKWQNAEDFRHKDTKFLRVEKI